MSYKRAIITGFGGPEVLKIVEEAALPEHKPGEVRIKVLVTSAAFTDVNDSQRKVSRCEG